MSAAALELPIVFGGHSFIQALGNEERPSDARMDEIVTRCLDAGIVWFDTTYQPERKRCGEVLERLGRRAEAKIIAWPFFSDFGLDEQIQGGYEAWRPEHLSILQHQCRSDFIDGLIIHACESRQSMQEQIELASTWKADGHIGCIGLWSPPPDAASAYRDAPIDFCTDTWRYTTQDPDMPVIFQQCKQAGWTIHCTSPFNRGWDLDAFVANTKEKIDEPEGELRARLADHLIRYSFSLPCVDRVIIGFRQPEYIESNIASYRRGPLDAAELGWLAEMRP